ncbi:MAG: DegV family protein [Actinomycetota bacterium]|nr:DegV family protein [Actinomycetota bacterium]
MASIGVVTDSAADLGRDIAAAKGLTVVPLTVTLDGRDFVDQVELSTEEFWSRCRSGAVPSTAAPSIGAFREAFLESSQHRDGVLCVTLASRFSATYQAACAAAQSVRAEVRVRVVDSTSVSVGQGLMVLAACELATKAASLDHLADQVTNRLRHIRLVGLLDTLDHLRRGGRIGGLRALLGQILSVKPVVEVKDGEVELLSRERTRRRGLAALAKEAVDHDPGTGVTLAHASAPDLDDILSVLGDHGLPVPTAIRDFGAVIGSHVGPGAVGLAFAVRPASD